MTLTILHLGATGYVGGGVLNALLQSPPEGLSRLILPFSSQSKVDAFEKWRASLSSASYKGQIETPVISRDDTKAWYGGVEKYASESDVTINAATSDDMELTKAINRGLAQGKQNNGKKGGLVHLSGVQLIESEPLGEYIETPLYDDGDAKSIASIPDSAAHRSIDLEIVEADVSDSIWASIVCPALIWGPSPGPGAKLSTLYPDMVRKSLHNKHATYVGTGKNVWVHVSLRDVVDLIVRLAEMHLQKSAPAKRQAHEGFYFASYNDELVEFKTLAANIGHVLCNERKIIESAEPQSVPCPPYDKSMKGVRIEDAARSKADAEIDASTPIWPCRTNCRCIARRGQEVVGWKARDRFEEEAQRQDVRDSLEVILADK